jgi:HPt (histidine-containing phosphotransfer) domain-containing protein
VGEPFETETPSPSGAPAPAVDRGAVRQLEEQLGKESLAALATAFLDRTPDRLADLRDAVEAEDPAAVREQAHALTGAARSFGAAELGELAARLEHHAAAGSLGGAGELLRELAACSKRTRAELEQHVGLTGTGHESPRPIRVAAIRSAVCTRPRRTAQSPPPEARVAELEHRVASLEQSVVRLLARLDG